MYDCREECQNLGGVGTLNTFGTCDCEQNFDPRSLCMDDCLTCRPTSSIQRVNGQHTVIVLNCEGVEIYREPFLDMYSFGSDMSNPRNFQLVLFPPDGSVRGSLLFNDQETINSLNEINRVSTNSRKKRNLDSVGTDIDRFRRQSELEPLDPLPQTIPNPLICLEVGEAVVFQISQDANSSLFHYPVYIKEHLLNSNPGFDYGAFRQLAKFIESGVNISLFLHVFSEPGTYYFSDSIIFSSQTAVIVMQDGTTCERGGDDFRILPSSNSYLIQFGIMSQPILNEEPNFAVISGVTVTGFLVLCIVVLGILIWRPKSVGIKIPNTLKPRYRRLNEPKIVYISEASKDLDTLEKRGVGVGAPIPQHPTEISSELENFNVKTFYDKLEDQTLHVSAQLARQQADLVRFYDQILQQTETLKSLVSESQVKASVERNRQFQDVRFLSPQMMERERPVGSETANCSYYQNSVPPSSQEMELMAILKDVLTEAGKKSTQKNKPTLQRWILPNGGHDRALMKMDCEEVAVKMETLVSMDRGAVCANYIYLFFVQEFNYHSELEKESVVLAEQLIGTTSEEEALHLLNEHDHRMKLIDARNERTKAEQMESFKKKLASRQKKKRTIGFQEVYSIGEHSFNFFMLTNFIQSNIDETCNGVIATHQKTVMLAVAEERLEVANSVIQDTEEGFSAFCNEIDELVSETLNTLACEGTLSMVESKQLSRECAEQNEAVLKSFTDTKKKQFKRLNDRMMEKKKSKQAHLREKHEAEKKEVPHSNLIILYSLNQLYT